MKKSVILGIVLAIVTLLFAGAALSFALTSTSSLPSQSYIKTWALKEGDVIYKSNFSDLGFINSWKANNSNIGVINENGKTYASVNVPVGQEGLINMAGTEIDLSQFSGMKLRFHTRVRAWGVSQPSATNLGVKFMLHYTSIQGDNYINPNNLYGTFDWRDVDFAVVVPEGINTNATLALGLQGSYGRADFDDITISIVSMPTSSSIAPFPTKYTGHNGVDRLRGVMGPETFKESDIQNLGKNWKANLIRWQIIPSSSGNDGYDSKDITKYDAWLRKKLDETKLALDACQKYGLKMVIDMHSPIGWRAGNDDYALFYDRTYNDHFVDVWMAIAAKFKGHPALWAYDIMNEPLQRGNPPAGMDYLSTQVRAAKAIRLIDPDTAILIESEDWAGITPYKYMKPVDVPNVVYEFHMYAPMGFTHQGVYDDNTNITYPGTINGRYYDKNTLRSVLQPVLDFQKKYNVQIYVGEFSAVRWAPGAAQYLTDATSLFEEYGWDWTYHAYREWSGWSLEHNNLPAGRNTTPVLSTTDTDRKKAILKWFAKNQKPSMP